MSDLFLLILIGLIGYALYLYLTYKDKFTQYFDSAVEFVGKYTPVGWIAYAVGWLSSPNIESPQPQYDDKELSDEIKKKLDEYSTDSSKPTPTPRQSVDQLPLQEKLFFEQRKQIDEQLRKDGIK